MDRAARNRAVGLVGGLTAGFVLTQTTLTGLAPPAFAGSLLLAVLLTEGAIPRPEPPPTPTAALEVRRARDYLPGRATRGVIALSVTVVAAIAAIGLHGLTVKPDILVSPPDGSSPSDYYDTGWYGPFSEYGPWAGRGMGGFLASTLVTVLTVLAFAVLALWLLPRVPRGGSSPDDRRLDEMWRRTTASTVMATAGVVVSLALTLVGFAAAMAMAEGQYGSELEATLWTPVPAVIGALAVLAFVGYVSMLLRPVAAATPAEPDPDLAVTGR